MHKCSPDYKVLRYVKHGQFFEQITYRLRPTRVHAAEKGEMTFILAHSEIFK